MINVTILYLCNSCEKIGTHNCSIHEQFEVMSIAEQLHIEKNMIKCINCHAGTQFLKHKDAILTADLQDYFNDYINIYKQI